MIMTITVEDGPEDNKLRIRMTIEPQEIDPSKASVCEQAALKLFAAIAQFAADKATRRQCD